MAILAQIHTVSKPIGQHLVIGVWNYVVFVFKVFLLWLITSPANADEILKCKSHAGQIIYSNVLCENQGASSSGTIEVSPSEIGRTNPSRVEANRGTILEAPRVPIAATEGGAGVFYVNGYIGDKPVRFIVDTGASEVSIPYRKALELGIPIFVGQRAEATTASNQVGIYRFRLNSITIGNITVRNVAAQVTLNIGGSENVLLGMSFLRYVTLVVRHGVLTIDP